MSRISEKGSVGAIELFKQYTSASTGTGVVDPAFVTYPGQKFDTSDGREVTLVSVAATALASGVIVQSPAITANHQTLAVAVPTATPATAGTFAVSVTLGATVMNAGEYAQGYLIVKDGTGAGQTLKIANNPAAAASAAGVIITLEDAIVTTLDATSVVNLIRNPYANVIIAPTTATGNVLGATFYPLAASVANTYNGTSGALLTTGTAQYGLVVSKGIASVLSDASVATVGLGIMRSTTTAGTITVQTATGANIGNALQTTISAKYGAVYLDC